MGSARGYRAVAVAAGGARVGNLPRQVANSDLAGLPQPAQPPRRAARRIRKLYRRGVLSFRLSPV